MTTYCASGLHNRTSHEGALHVGPSVGLAQPAALIWLRLMNAVGRRARGLIALAGVIHPFYGAHLEVRVERVIPQAQQPIVGKYQQAPLALQRHLAEK